MGHFAVTHAEVGAYLPGLWGIPFLIVEVVAFQHRPNEVAPESRAQVAAVHMASGVVEEMTEAEGAPWARWPNAPEAPPARADHDRHARLA